MSTPLSHVRLNLEQIKKQARELLQGFQSGQSDPLARLQSAAPHIDPRDACLADAQFVIAREQGFESWPKFKRHIEIANADFDGKVDAFIMAATSNRLVEAERLLEELPSIATANVYAAVAYGDVDTVRRLVDRTPTLATTNGGPRKWPPIVYTCLSRFIADREQSILDIVRLLLDLGADPNTSWLDGDWRLPILYGACGQLNNVPLASMLIDAGANVDDNESLYHSTEFRDHACTRLLLQRGAKVDGTNALKHQLDVEDLDGLRLLLDYGGDPNETNDHGENALHWAIYRRRSVDCVRMLIDAGADVNAARVDGMTPYRMAWQAGLGEVEELLRERGAQVVLRRADELIHAAASGVSETVRSIVAEHPETIANLSHADSFAFVSLADEGNTLAVALLLDAGFPLDARGDHKATALHWAAWRGRVDTVRLLIERGAEVEVEGADLGSTPLQWAIHASANNPDMRPEDAVAVVDLLMDAGAVPRMLEMASAEVRRHIEESCPGSRGALQRASMSIKHT